MANIGTHLRVYSFASLPPSHSVEHFSPFGPKYVSDGTFRSHTGEPQRGKGTRVWTFRAACFLCRYVRFFCAAGSIFVPLLYSCSYVAALGLCLIKEMLLDLQRRATDRWRNCRVCTIIDGRRPQLKMVHWEALRVGNIVRLTDDEEVPADVVVLATSNPEGIAYVETSKLDGETTLKFKQGVKETRTETYPLAIAGIRGRVVCEKPTSSMDSFSGSLKLDAHPRATSLDLSNFIHRGAHIRNTEWVYGVVVYTGHDTRTLRSARHPSLKFAHIESEVNSYTIVSFFIIALLILISVMSKSSVQVRSASL